MIELEQRPFGADSKNDDDLIHVYCDCDENRGLCGADIADSEQVPWYYSGSDVCIVCDDLDNFDCERCGR